MEYIEAPADTSEKGLGREVFRHLPTLRKKRLRDPDTDNSGEVQLRGNCVGAHWWIEVFRTSE